MAIEIAEAVVGALRGELAATAVNAPMVPAEVSLYLYLLIKKKKKKIIVSLFCLWCQDLVFYINCILDF